MCGADWYICYCPACGLPGYAPSGQSPFAARVWSDGRYAATSDPDAETLLVHPGCGHYAWRSQLYLRLPATLRPKAPGIRQKKKKYGALAEGPHPVYLALRADSREWKAGVRLYNQSRILLGRHGWHPREFLTDDVPEFAKYELNPIVTAKEWQTAWRLGVAGEDGTRRRILLMRWWWTLHDYDYVWDAEAKVCKEVLHRDATDLETCLNALLPLLRHPRWRLDKAEVLRQLGRLDEAKRHYALIHPETLSEEDPWRYRLVGRLLETGRTEPVALGFKWDEQRQCWGSDDTP